MEALIGIDFANLDWQKTAKSSPPLVSASGQELPFGAARIMDEQRL
jgi:hypothetical protein